MIVKKKANSDSYSYLKIDRNGDYVFYDHPISTCIRFDTDEQATNWFNNNFDKIKHLLEEGDKVYAYGDCDN